MAFTKNQERVLRSGLFRIPILFSILPGSVLRLSNYESDIPLFNTLSSNPNYYAVDPKLGQLYFLLQNLEAKVSRTEVFL